MTNPLSDRHLAENALLMGMLRAILQRDAFPALPEPLNWCGLIEKAYGQKVAPLIGSALKQQGMFERIPAEQRTRFETYLQNQRKKTRFLALQLIHVMKLLDEAGIPALPFKGAPLAMLTYGELAMRQFDDHDILVPAARIHDAKRIALSDNYRLDELLLDHIEERPLPEGEYHYKFFHQTRWTYLELHWKVAWSGLHRQDFLLPFEALAERSVKVRVLGSESDRNKGINRRQEWHPYSGLGEWGVIPTLSPEDALLVLSTDTLKQERVPVSRLMDAAALIDQTPHFDADALMRRAEAAGAARIVLASLASADQLFGLPESCRTLLRKHRRDVSTWVVNKIRDDVYDTHTTGTIEFARMRTGWLLREKAGDRLRYAGRIGGSSTALRLLAAQFSLYFLSRIYATAGLHRIAIIRQGRKRFAAGLTRTVLRERATLRAARLDGKWGGKT